MLTNGHSLLKSLFLGDVKKPTPVKPARKLPPATAPKPAANRPPLPLPNYAHSSHLAEGNSPTGGNEPMSLPFLPVRSESLTSWNLPKPVFASNSTSNSNSPTNICTTTVVSVSGDAKSAGKVVREKCSAASFAQISLEKSLACHVTGVRECVGYLICAFILLERMEGGEAGGVACLLMQGKSTWKF